MWFKRKNKDKCFHEWRVSDYDSYVDSSLDIEEYYELTCVLCQNSRNVDEYLFDKMKSIGLIKGGKT